MSGYLVVPDNTLCGHSVKFKCTVLYVLLYLVGFVLAPPQSSLLTQHKELC